MMGAATSKPLATLSLILLPFNVVTLVLRFWIRLSRKAWGSDDWAMLVAVPFLIVTTVSMIALAWSGLGLKDEELVGDQLKQGLFWYFVAGTIWTFWVLTLKWSIGFTILRIAHGKRWVTWTIYISLVLMTLASGSTGIFQFVQCTPMKAIWDPDVLANGGKCINRSYLAGLSTTLAAVSIATDWYMALIPIPLLWNIQMDPRIKLSVVVLLALGIFASIAGIVRFAVLVKATPAVATGLDYLYILDPIMTWAQAEPAIATVAANLPALRPLLEKALGQITSFSSRNKSSNHTGLSAPRPNQYLELEERQKRNERIKGMGGRISDEYSGGDSKSILGDNESQTKIVNPSGGIRVENKFEVSRE